jgi:hypothetical protein
MTLSFFLACALTVFQPGDSVQKFQQQLTRNIRLQMELPPNYNSLDTCNHYTELLKVEIDKSSHIVSITFSDSAPDWLKNDITRIKEQKRIDYEKLDSLALKARLRSCLFVFPLIIESDDFPCGQENKKRKLNDNYFQFEGKSLKGNIIFGESIYFYWGTNVLRK